jgi:hypothetical protein
MEVECPDGLPRCIPIAPSPLDAYRGTGSKPIQNDPSPIGEYKRRGVLVKDTENSTAVKKEKKKPGRKKKPVQKLSIETKGITLVFD